MHEDDSDDDFGAGTGAGIDEDMLDDEGSFIESVSEFSISRTSITMD